MPQRPPIDAAHAAALIRWQAPFPGFTSGHDPRTSDSSLLILLYGGLVHAARHEWLNAGRRLIDKTYIDMLWHVQALTDMRTCRPEQISASLDNFIQATLRDHWETLPALSPAAKQELANSWVSEIAETCFGSLHSELAASRLLFYLCPMLPVFNLSRGHLLALEQWGHPYADSSYKAYAESAGAAYRKLAPVLRSLPRPISESASPPEQRVIQQLLDQTDWWPRRVFDEMIRQHGQSGRETQQDIFACDDAGQFVT